MSESSMQERNEAPTPKRRREAREKGQVARSQELSTAVLLFAGAITLQLVGVTTAALLVRVFQASTEAVPWLSGDPHLVAAWLRRIGWLVLAGLAPFVLLVSGATLFANAVQARGIVSTKVIGAQWSRLSPAQNSKRLFSTRPIADLVKSILKLIVLGGASYLTLRGAWPDLVHLSQESPVALLQVVHRYASRLLLATGLAFMAVAAIDYGYQLWQHEKNLRMSREDLRREQKDTEGDMLVKARLRSLGRSLARNRMLNDVPDADVVLTNPTQIAVAIRYDPERAPAPVIVAMGQRKVAERIRRIAHEHDVPVLENKPLARALFAAGRIGSVIPAELYVAVAEVIAFVMRHGRRSRFAGVEIQ